MAYDDTHFESRPTKVYEGVSEYTYGRLDASKQQIRLLRLASRKSTDSLIQCQLETYDLETAPKYTALSYTWGKARVVADEDLENTRFTLGSPVSSHVILVDGQPLRISENLFDFLETFHSNVANTTRLWIDQLCIDQTHREERSHQVQLMSTIYSFSTHVLTWLGKDSGVVRAAREFVQNKSSSSWTFFKHPYFSRLWIVQEFLLAPIGVLILCGDIWISWNDLIVARDQGGGVLAPLAWLVEGRRYMASGAHSFRYPLLTCLQQFGQNACQDPRDKVYGLLGLTVISQRPDVDYRKSNVEVFLDAVQIVFNHPDRALQPLSKKPQAYDSILHRLRTPSFGSAACSLFQLSQSMDIALDDIGLQSLLVALESLSYYRILHDSKKRITAVGFGSPHEHRSKRPLQQTARSDAGNRQIIATWWYEYQGKRYSFPSTIATPVPASIRIEDKGVQNLEPTLATKTYENGEKLAMVDFDSFFGRSSTSKLHHFR